MRARKSRGQWAEIVGAFEAGDQDVERFCARRRLAPATFRWWRWRLADAAAATPCADVRLVPVEVLPARGGGTRDGHDVATITVVGVEVRVPVGLDVAYVAALVSELRSRC